MSNVRGKAINQIALAVAGWQRCRVKRPAVALGLGLTVALSIALSVWQPVKAQDGAPEPEPEADFCLVSLSAEKTTLRIGEPLRVWVWGIGVEEPGSWNLEVDGDGSLALRGARELASWAEMVELTLAGVAEGKASISASMICRKPGIGADSLTLTVLPAEPEVSPTPQSTTNFCTTHLSLSAQQVPVGDSFYVWFVGAGTGPRSWNLAMSGDGSAQLVGTRELDPKYVEWELEAVSPGSVRLTATMDCAQLGNGVSSGEVAITEETDPFGAAQTKRIWTPRTVATIEAALLVVLLAVFAVLVYLLIRRRW